MSCIDSKYIPDKNREGTWWKSCTSTGSLNFDLLNDNDDECNKSEGSSIIMPPAPPPYATGSTTTTYSAKEYK